MTTRDYLKARTVRVQLIDAAIVLLLLGISLWRPRGQVLGVGANGVVLAAVAFSVAVYVVYMRRTPCLRCGAPLGNTALNWNASQPPPPRCAGCGLGLDEVVSGPPAH